MTTIVVPRQHAQAGHPKLLGRTGYFRVVSHQRREGDRAASVVEIPADVIPSPPSGDGGGVGFFFVHCTFVFCRRRFRLFMSHCEGLEYCVSFLCARGGWCGEFSLCFSLHINCHWYTCLVAFSFFAVLPLGFYRFAANFVAGAYTTVRFL